MSVRSREGVKPLVHTAEGMVKAETLIIASGASAKWLGIPGEAPEVRKIKINAMPRKR